MDIGALLPRSGRKHSHGLNTAAAAVNCTRTTRYSPSGGGWHGDPLFLIGNDASVSVVRNMATPLWLTVSIPSETPPGTYNGSISVMDGTKVLTELPVSLAVWKYNLPTPAEMYKSFGEIWSFTTNQFTGTNLTTGQLPLYLDAMSEALLPPDSLYKQEPYADFG